MPGNIRKGKDVINNSITSTNTQQHNSHANAEEHTNEGKRENQLQCNNLRWSTVLKPFARTVEKKRRKTTKTTTTKTK